MGKIEVKVFMEDPLKFLSQQKSIGVRLSLTVRYGTLCFRAQLALGQLYDLILAETFVSLIQLNVTGLNIVKLIRLSLELAVCPHNRRYNNHRDHDDNLVAIARMVVTPVLPPLFYLLFFLF